MKKLLEFIIVILTFATMLGFTHKMAKKEGIEKGREIEKTEFLVKTVIPTSELSKRETNNFSANYIFYDETYAQVVSIYSDLKEAEVNRLVRYLYPSQCKLILLSVQKVDTINQGLNNPENIKDKDTPIIE